MPSRTRTESSATTSRNAGFNDWPSTSSAEQASFKAGARQVGLVDETARMRIGQAATEVGSLPARDQHDLRRMHRPREFVREGEPIAVGQLDVDQHDIGFEAIRL